jgi:hypothetical protein
LIGSIEIPRPITNPKTGTAKKLSGVPVFFGVIAGNLKISRAESLSLNHLWHVETVLLRLDERQSLAGTAEVPPNI